MARASDELLDLIHKLAATALKDEIERALERAALPRTIEVQEDGQAVIKPNPDYAAVNPQLIDKALKFLKDNGVDSPAKSERIDSLASTLGQLNLDDEAVSLRTH